MAPHRLGLRSGSDRFLAVFLTFHRKRTGLTRVGWAIIDMRPPQPLVAGERFSSESLHQTPPGPYSGIFSIDFAVTVHRTGTIKVDVSGAAGVDSSKWGEFVQNFIHKKVSTSPLLPWLKDSTKFVRPGRDGGASDAEAGPEQGRGVRPARTAPRPPWRRAT